MRILWGKMKPLCDLNADGLYPKPVTCWRDKDSGEMNYVRDARPIDLFAKVVEETAEAMRDYAKMEARIASRDSEIAERHRQSLGMELTDIITAATTLLNTLGFDLSDRAELVYRVNTKNQKRGYHDDTAN